MIGSCQRLSIARTMSGLSPPPNDASAGSRGFPSAGEPDENESASRRYSRILSAKACSCPDSDQPKGRPVGQPQWGSGRTRLTASVGSSLNLRIARTRACAESITSAGMQVFSRSCAEGRRRALTLVDGEAEQQQLVPRVAVLVDNLHLLDDRALARLARACVRSAEARSAPRVRCHTCGPTRSVVWSRFPTDATPSRPAPRPRRRLQTGLPSRRILTSRRNLRASSSSCLSIAYERSLSFPLGALLLGDSDEDTQPIVQGSGRGVTQECYEASETEGGAARKGTSSCQKDRRTASAVCERGVARAH